MSRFAEPRGGPRAEACRILLRVDRDGAFAAPLLERAEAGLGDARDRALLHELVLGTLRGLPELDRAIGLLSARPAASIDPEVRAALRLGLHQILRLDRIPAHAAVDGSVEAVRSVGAPRAAGFVNALLRRAAREGPRLRAPEPTPGDAASLALVTGHPEWWARRAIERFGWERGRRFLEAHSVPAPVVLRVAAGIDPADLAQRLGDERVAVTASPWLPRALRAAAGNPAATRAFRDGAFYIQDEASQLVPMLAGVPGPGAVVDVCAAPGGKAIQLAETVGEGRLVLALDRSSARARRIVDNAARCRAGNVRVAVADAADRLPVVAGSAALVLVDAPCSGTGTLRRHPEILGRLRESDLGALAARQGRILRRAAAAVAPGGTLVYSVCSTEPEEGERVVGSFLSEHPEFALDDPTARLPEPCRRFVGPDGALRTGGADDLDGFYAAALLRA